MRRPRDDYNSGWQSVVRSMLPHLFAFFFADVHAAIDWNRPVEFLDKEMEYAVRLAGKGKKTVDTLIKVWLKSGEKAWMLLHLEFQNQVDPTFGQRMFGYNVLMYVRHRVTVASFAILGDPDTSWRPESFEYGAFGGATGIKFRTVKLLDYREHVAELEQSDNPFAHVVLTHLRAIATSRNSKRRRQDKEALTIRLLESGWPQETIVDLHRFLELVMPLPLDLEAEYRAAVSEYERRRKVPVLTQWEKMAMKEGRDEGRQEGQQEGLQRGLRQVLDGRFPEAPASLRERLLAISDAETLEQLIRSVAGAQSLAEVERALDKAQA